MVLVIWLASLTKLLMQQVSSRERRYKCKWYIKWSEGHSWTTICVRYEVNHETKGSHKFKCVNSLATVKNATKCNLTVNCHSTDRVLIQVYKLLLHFVHYTVKLSANMYLNFHLLTSTSFITWAPPQVINHLSLIRNTKARCLPWAAPFWRSLWSGCE